KEQDRDGAHRVRAAYSTLSLKFVKKFFITILTPTLDYLGVNFHRPGQWMRIIGRPADSASAF
ncbi:hypothetical protein LZ645_19195, partial [Shewanella algae]|uniref:hypothetical protein n=1 Tax=Shewanella algae TaxID=38313 RepID=UPI001F392CA8